MIPILWQEFRAKRWSLLAYCGSVALLIWLYITLFPTIQAQSQALAGVLKSYARLYKALGIDEIGFSTLERYLNTEMFSLVWPLLMAILVISRAGSAIAGEIEKGTMGTLLALPISRANLFLSKYFAGLLALVLFATVSVFVAPPLASAYHISYALINFVSLFVLGSLFGWAIFSLAIFLSSVVDERGKVYLIMGAGLVAMYVANIVATLKPSLDWVKYLSLFHYYNASAVLGQNQVSLVSYAVFGGIIVVFTLAGVVWFSKRDVAV